jgi:hypothetical protein
MSNGKGVEWSHSEQYTSSYGTVSRVDGEEWIARVVMPNGTMGRLRDSFPSVEAAKATIVRVWEKVRENVD